MRVDSSRVFEVRQGGEGIIKVVRRQQDKLQVLPRVLSPRGFLPLQDFLHEGALVCRQTVTATTGIKQRIAVSGEQWAEPAGRLRHRQSRRICRVGPTRSVIEQYGWKRPRTPRHP